MTGATPILLQTRINHFGYSRPPFTPNGILLDRVGFKEQENIYEV